MSGGRFSPPRHDSGDKNNDGTRARNDDDSEREREKERAMKAGAERTSRKGRK